MTNEMQMIESARTMILELAKGFYQKAPRYSHCCEDTVSVLGQCHECGQDCDSVISAASFDLIEEAHSLAEHNPVSEEAVESAKKLTRVSK
jgi:hypothetical protein